MKLETKQSSNACSSLLNCMKGYTHGDTDGMVKFLYLVNSLCRGALQQQSPVELGWLMVQSRRL